MRRPYFYGEIYAYRTKKPGAPFGLPMIGRHWAYVGQTRNPEARHGEHMRGGGRYGRAAQPWSDLAPRRYVLWRSDRCPQWLLNLMERLFIALFQPVYNVQHNRANFRRIIPRRALRHRLARDMAGWSWSIMPQHVLSVAGLLLAAVVVMYR